MEVLLLWLLHFWLKCFSVTCSGVFFWGGEGEGKVWACLSEEIECRNAFCRFLVVGGLLEVCVGWVFV